MNRQSSQLLLLPQLHHARLPPPGRHGPRHDRCADRLARRRQGLQAGRGDLRQSQDGVGARVGADF